MPQQPSLMKNSEGRSARIGSCEQRPEDRDESGEDSRGSTCSVAQATVDGVLQSRFANEETREHVKVSFTNACEDDEALLLEKIGRFQVRELLGDGVYGKVYRAYDPRLDREVAVKVLRTSQSNARVLERFFREARAAARLDHPNIVPLHDAGRDGGRFWIAYQFVGGTTLAKLGKSKKINPIGASRIVRALADAIDHAHRRGVYHRDLKPANVLIDDAGRPRLIDFGLARRVDCESTLTHEGTILGTPAYMSPEQAAGKNHRVDARSDVFSLGVILLELLQGRRLKVARSDDKIFERESPEFARDVPRSLRSICERTLAPDPSDRYPNARQLAEDLDLWLAREGGFGLRLRRTMIGFVSRVAIGRLIARVGTK